MRLPRFLRLIPIFFLVAACASLPQPVHHQTDFRQKMRIGYNHAGKGGSADLLWEQSGNDYVAVLSAGSELARMRRSGENRTLIVREDFAARVDLRHFPLAYLEYWIRLSPHPAFPAEMDRNARGQIVSIRQNGWEIVYLKYKNGYPRLIRAQKPPSRVTLAVLERT